VTIEFDSVTMFDNPLQRIRTGQIARVPILLGNLEDDGTVFALAAQNLSATIALLTGPSGAAPLSPNVVRGLYPGLSDPQVIAAMWRDIGFRWCVIYLAWVKRITNITNTC
jgi:carboxylesterase type B